VLDAIRAAVLRAALGDEVVAATIEKGESRTSPRGADRANQSPRDGTALGDEIVAARERRRDMTIMIRNLHPSLHRALKVAAARAGCSMNKFVLDAIRAAVLRAALGDEVVAATIEKGEEIEDKPARS
jgi:plasmid stability protein